MCNPKKHFIRQIHPGHEHNWSLIQVDDDYVEPADAHRCPNRWEQSAAPSPCVAAKICARCTTAVWIMGRHRANGDGALTGGSRPWIHLHALQQQLVLVAERQYGSRAGTVPTETEGSAADSKRMSVVHIQQLQETWQCPPTAIVHRAGSMAFSGSPKV